MLFLLRGKADEFSLSCTFRLTRISLEKLMLFPSCNDIAEEAFLLLSVVLSEFMDEKI
jgi:hypothetical protein